MEGELLENSQQNAAVPTEEAAAPLAYVGQIGYNTHEMPAGGGSGGPAPPPAGRRPRRRWGGPAKPGWAGPAARRLHQFAGRNRPLRRLPLWQRS